ncbi:MAG: Helix-turn-helix domain protein [candidate division CPR1 bacterium ADurb.Bin160]|jgi:transcriptional regulator with XRE-family HTH domain|uniref:Helix-turn-helix domain protein n=1 Tax=candidate division CPR1 bacterium ADurb.Bin160 TaxID=1852826 RepID=A0A1V5ZR10_9BACT|nr:MAG: Helix-turn-helix domain protein [candidate division CPR1 bacterium ADurb.Bin160]
MDYLSKKIKTLRNYANLSQAQMANLLKISRVTYANIESGKRDLKKNEIEKIAHIFELSIENLLEKPVEKTKITKNHPLNKMIQTILYILSQCAGKPNVGKIVLNKLLYFADFNHYEKYWTSITGDLYIKMPM